MMLSDIKLDTTRYITKFGDKIIESCINGNLTAHITENENVLITQKETYSTEATKEECPDKDEIFDMIKFIISKNKGIISGETVETVLRTGDPDLMDSLIATFFLTWIMTDSWNFRFDEWEESIRVSRNNLLLLEKWAKKKLIIDNIFRSKSYEDLELMQTILGRMKKSNDIIYSRYSQAELDSLGLHPDSADYALYLICDIKDQDLVILWKEKEDCIKFSLRAKWKYNCRDIAIQFWWWWHANAAWCSVEKWWDIETTVVNFVGKVQSIIK